MTTDIKMDIESTGISVYNSEIIEAYFYIDETNNFYLKCKPDNWSYEAEQVHKIPEHVAMNYPSKKDAYREFLKWLPKDFRFVTYANKNTELGHINFDVAILINELNLLGCKNYYLENTYQMKPNVSIHTLARKCASQGLFKPITGAMAYRLGITSRESAKASNRQSLAQSSVYYSLFGELFKDAHSCVADVGALCKIEKELVRLMNENPTMLI